MQATNIFQGILWLIPKLGNRFRAIWGSRLETFYLKLNSTRDDRTPINVKYHQIRFFTFDEFSLFNK
jgi:hypothetical protein